MTINEPTITTNFGVRSTKVMIVVKANAYGHGLTEVAKYLDLQVITSTLRFWKKGFCCGRSVYGLRFWL